MAKGQLPTRLVIHACPAAETHLIPSITLWASQPLLLGFQAGRVNLRLTELEAENLVSQLALVPNTTFELTQTGRDSGVLFMHLPSQGIFRGQLNSAGSLTLSEERLQLMLDQAAGNHREFTRLLRLALGQSWDDLLEPFRAIRHSENVLLLNRAG